MSASRYRGSSALVTGASSGVGEAFARALAAAGADVLLTALPEERDELERIARELATSHRVRTEVVPMDLSAPGGPESLVAAADQLDFEPRVLVNNAGFGTLGAFCAEPLERQTAMIRLNVIALVTLTGTYLPRMIRRRDGIVVNVASTAAFQPLPYFAVYAATKAFVLSFGEALWAEAREEGVRVVTVCTGPVSTRFLERAAGIPEQAAAAENARRPTLTTEAVVQAAFAAVEADRPRTVLRVRGGGVLHAALATVGSVVPRRWEMLMIERISRRLWLSG